VAHLQFLIASARGILLLVLGSFRTVCGILSKVWSRWMPMKMVGMFRPGD